MTAEAEGLSELQRRWVESKHFRARLDAIPHVPEATTYVDAGVVRLGIEGRVVDNEVIERYRRADSSVPVPDRAVHEEGLSLHVFAAADGRELLRFDCFDERPHYHYLVPGLDGITVLYHDELANGPMLAWTIRALRERLGAMLAGVGSEDLANELDDATVDRAMDDVVAILRALGAKPGE